MTGGLKAAPATRQADPAVVAEFGATRYLSLVTADSALDQAADYLVGIEAAGGRVNVRRMAGLLDVSRDTLYKRLTKARTRAAERTTP
jgi:transcriptional regulator of acetoin/glycerol metabolism